MRRGPTAALTILICALSTNAVEARGPSTREERARVVALTRALEEQPFSADAPTTREWLRQWVIEVPDISVKVCDQLFEPHVAPTYPYAKEINLQRVFGAAGFAIEHPGKAMNVTAQYTAGVESALRLYEVLLASRPDSRLPFLDDLQEARSQGRLAQRVSELAKGKCKETNIDLIAALAGSGVALGLGFIVARLFGPRRQNAAVTTNAGRLELIVLACVIYYLVIGAALHVLEPDFDPRYRFMSEYAWGRYGWLMTTTFFVLGSAMLTVALALRLVHVTSRGVRLGVGLLIVGSVFVCLAGVFREFIPHLAASAVAIPSMVMGTLFLSWGFRRVEAWRQIRSVTVLIAVAMLALFLAMMSRVGMPGLEQRAFLVLFLSWLAIVIHRAARLARREERVRG